MKKVRTFVSSSHYVGAEREKAGQEQDAPWITGADVARLPSAANIADAYPAFTSVNNFFGWEDIEGRSQRSLFSMDGTRLATIGKDGTSRMLDVSPEDSLAKADRRCSGKTMLRLMIRFCL